MNPTYVVNVSGVADAVKSPEQFTQALEALDGWERVENVTNEVTLESLGPSWPDYIDLGLKALLVIAAFAIYARL